VVDGGPFPVSARHPDAGMAFLLVEARGFVTSLGRLVLFINLAFAGHVLLWGIFFSNLLHTRRQQVRCVCDS